jgi:hypothetical protein
MAETRRRIETLHFLINIAENRLLNGIKFKMAKINDKIQNWNEANTIYHG